MTQLKPMEKIRIKITLDTADVYKQIPVNIPSSKTESMAVFIWGYWAGYEGADAPVDADNYYWQLTKSSQSQIIDFSNQDVILAGGFRFSMTTSGLGIITRPESQYFPKPLIVATNQAFFAFDTNGQSTAKTMELVIFYTIEKVTKEVFIDALVQD